ncbi:MAG: prephenate/arogenate dehydrogenase [Cyanobacteria bacterium]|nr:prephenate/arogenate dehydrogenase [Cyanobacteriota bacterium]MDW8199736.1 prephenate/arogenate dehydrogenase [Cyanobacteriota bacterium SKYGB_h_bin112]
MDIGIVGLGLIGGSLGLSLRSTFSDSNGCKYLASLAECSSSSHRVLGVSRREEVCRTATALGATDEASTELSLLSSADIVFICTPLAVIASIVEQLVQYLSADAIITDVGSVKQPVVAAVSPLWQNFVGGHPMAGTADSGIDAAQLGLFVNRPYVLTPNATTPARAVAWVSAIVNLLGAKLYQCSPEEHDRAVAWISHLPVFASASLIAACLGESDPYILDLAKSFASSGFRDTSRVGGGNPELGLMMAMYNQPALLRSLYAYRAQCDRLIDALEKHEWTTIATILHQTQQARPEFL